MVRSTYPLHSSRTGGGSLRLRFPRSYQTTTTCVKEKMPLPRRPTVGGLCQTDGVTGVAAGPGVQASARGGVEQLGRSLGTGPGREESLRHLRILPRRPAVVTPWPEW